jgi:UDP-N-acetylmuramate dehydrogenase
MKILKNASLKERTTYKIGGLANYLVTLEKDEDIEEFLNLQNKFHLPIFVLAGGSNVLISDDGFKGFVIQPNFDYIIELDDLIFRIGAGVMMSDLVEFFNNRGLSGLENAGGLPGTLGGAVRGNAGCFGFEIKDLILEVKAVNMNSGETKIFKNNDCEFSYRSSIFKRNPEWLIVDVVLKTSGLDNKENLWKITQERINYRKERQPLEYPNAGSVFKNAAFETAPKFVQDLALEKNKIKNDPFPIIPTAFLIAEAGLKGKKIGYAQISEKHPNFIINLGRASFNDVYQLIDYVQKTIQDKFGVILEPEIYILKG